VVFAARALASLDRAGEALPLLDRAAVQAATVDARHSAASSATALLPRLTERAHEVATLVERGRTNRQIASALRLSERTVESHLANIYRKLGVPTRAALAAILGAETARRSAVLGGSTALTDALPRPQAHRGVE